MSVLCAYLHAFSITQKQVPSKKYPQLVDLGLKSTVDMKENAVEYLRHYRKGGHFSATKEDTA